MDIDCQLHREKRGAGGRDELVTGVLSSDSLSGVSVVLGLLPGCEGDAPGRSSRCRSGVWDNK